MRELDDAIARAAGACPVTYAPRSGGYSTAARFRVALADGRRVFVKSSDTPLLAGFLRREHEVYAALEGSFMPRFEGWDDDGTRATLLIEDLSEADWTPNWTADRVDAVFAALDELAASEPPPNTQDVRVTFADLWGRWEIVERDPEPFLRLGLRGDAWLERALPEVRAAAARAPIAGRDLCHLDVRSDNICFRDGRAILVDWNWASLGSTRADRGAWLPSLYLEGGPPPWEVLPDAGDVAAWIGGGWAAVAGTPPPPTAPHVRELQRRQLAVTLDWLDRELL